MTDNADDAHLPTLEDRKDGENEGASSPKKIKLSPVDATFSNGHSATKDDLKEEIHDAIKSHEASKNAVESANGVNEAVLKMSEGPAGDGVDENRDAEAESEKVPKEGVNSEKNEDEEDDDDDAAEAADEDSSTHKSPAEEYAASPALSTAVSTPVLVASSTNDSDSDVAILSSDDEEIRRKRDEAEKAKSHKAKQVLSSIKKIDIKALSSKLKLNVSKPLLLKPKIEMMKGSSDGISPVVTPSPSCVSEEDELGRKHKAGKDVKKEEAEEEEEDEESRDAWTDRGKGSSKGESSWNREASVTTEGSSRCSSPCEDPLESEPEEKKTRSGRNGSGGGGGGGDGENEESQPEGLTAEGVREAALKNAAIDEEYNVKNILSRLKAATLTLNNKDAVREAGENEEEEGGVQIVEKEKNFCEIILDSSDEEDEDNGEKKEGGDAEEVQIVANPNIRMLEQTQARKVAEQLSSAGVTVKNSKSVPKVPKQLFPKWQTISHIVPMLAPAPVNRPVKQPPPMPRHLQRPIKVLSLFDGVSGCLVALKQIGIAIDTYLSSEIDDFSKIVTMVRHPEVTQLGDPRSIDDRVLREHGPFDLVFGGLPCNDFENDGTLRHHKAGMHFQKFAELLQSCKRQHKKAGLGTPFHWLFYNVEIPQRYRDRISSTLNCDPIKLDAIHVSPMRKPDYFWSNIPNLEQVLTPLPILDRLNLQDCLEPDRVARVRRLNTFTVSFDSMRQGPYHQVPINHGGELDELWMVEVERVLGFPDHYSDVANLPPKDRLTILAMSGSVPLFRHVLDPLKHYYAHSGN